MVLRGLSLVTNVLYFSLTASQFSPDLFRMVRKVIEEEGALKVRSIAQATSLPQAVLDLTHHYVELCANFRSSGSDV